MSEDLRYYFFDHDAEEHPPISSEEGWNQMQQLLDKELPVSSKRNPGRRLFLIAAAFISVAFLIMAFPLKTYFKPNQIGKQVTRETDVKEYSTYSSTTGNTTNHTRPFQSEPEVAVHRQGVLEMRINSSASNLPVLKNKNNGKHLTELLQNVQPSIEADDKENITSGVETVTVPDTHPNITIHDFNNTTAEEKKKNKNATTNDKSWHFNAGLATNISFSNTLQSIRPYLFAEIKYQFRSNFFAGASVALFSPVGSNASGVKRIVYVNDNAYNVSNYNETINYTRLTYVDLALTGGIQLNKQISIQSGIQVSRFISAKTNTTLEPYDFNMNRVAMTGQDVSTLPQTPSAAPIYNNRIEVQKIDIRYLAGINYDLKKISLGLQYQGGFNPVLKGDAVSTNKNKLLTLKAAYRFR